MKILQTILIVIETLFMVGTLLSFSYYILPVYPGNITDKIQKFPLGFIMGCACMGVSIASAIIVQRIEKRNMNNV